MKIIKAHIVDILREIFWNLRVVIKAHIVDILLELFFILLLVITVQVGPIMDGLPSLLLAGLDVVVMSSMMIRWIKPYIYDFAIARFIYYFAFATTMVGMVIIATALYCLIETVGLCYLL